MARSLAQRLPETTHGQDWIAQFDASDRELARELLESLVLVSGTEFERRLTAMLAESALKARGPTAFFAVREWPDPTQPYLKEDDEADAVGPGGDIGSEGRVAAVIRGLCRPNPTSLLNHPSIQRMRDTYCREIVLVDDFVGSGDRVAEFFAALWAHPTIRSWHSLGLIAFSLFSYSATSRGERRVAKLLKREPTLVRGCPTFQDIPGRPSDRSLVVAGLRKYAQRTQFPTEPLGYGRTGAALVFEHGCPDNVPVIFWAAAGAGQVWQPLFPARSVLAAETSAFPPELIAPDAARVLQGVGQERLSRSGALSRRGAIGETILVLLGLISKRIRKRSALAHASGLTIEECALVIERCISWQFLTPAMRLTDRGTAELDFARRLLGKSSALPTIGSDEYYPRQLRGSGDG